MSGRSETFVTENEAKLTDYKDPILGIPLEKDLENWFGEPAKATRAEFYRQAKLMKLDQLRTKPDTEPLSDRLWRRYGRRAFDLLELIRADPADNLSNEALAEQVGLSGDRLQRLFKQTTGIPIRRYRLWHRLFVTS